MNEIFPLSKQRVSLLELAAVIDSREDALRRDDCGDYAIAGRVGYIFAIPLERREDSPVGYQLMIGCGGNEISACRWERAKKRLAFGLVTQDGDRDGAIVLGRMPSEAEALEIRKVLRIPKHRYLSEEARLRLFEHGAQTRFQRSGTASDQ